MSLILGTPQPITQTAMAVQLLSVFLFLICSFPGKGIGINVSQSVHDSNPHSDFSCSPPVFLQQVWFCSILYSLISTYILYKKKISTYIIGLFFFFLWLWRLFLFGLIISAERLDRWRWWWQRTEFVGHFKPKNLRFFF